MKNFTTPKGTAGFCNLITPDFKFDPDGKYKVNIVMSKKDAQPLIDLAEEEAQELAVLDKKTKKVVMPEAYKLPFKIDEEDGTVTLEAKTKKAPKLFDAKGNPIKGEAARAELQRISGSTIKVKGAFSSYEGFGGGVSAYLNDVQIIVLVEGGGGGFEDESGEDGYVADDSAPGDDTPPDDSDDRGEPAGPVEF